MIELAGVKCREIEVLTTKAGDIVLISSDKQISDAAAHNLVSSLKAILPDGVMCGILQDGLRVSVIRPDANEPEPEIKIKFREFL